LIYLTPSDGAIGLKEGELPVFISLSSDCYGFPLHNGLVKVADDNPYRAIDHPNQRREPENEYVRRVVERVTGFLPALARARVAKTHVCFYDRSKDERFILDAWDTEARIVYGCGMSGRAFKFAPVIGDRLACFAVSGQRPSDLAKARLHRDEPS
jgi:glycine/D-amino acid oxidase-like deaminating enzyme